MLLKFEISISSGARGDIGQSPGGLKMDQKNMCYHVEPHYYTAVTRTGTKRCNRVFELGVWVTEDCGGSDPYRTAVEARH